jgi:hypothetical protein
MLLLLMMELVKLGFIALNFYFFDTFKKWKDLVENEIGKRLKCLISDNRVQYCNNKFYDYFSYHKCNTPRPNPNYECKYKSTYAYKLVNLLISFGAHLPWYSALMYYAPK